MKKIIGVLALATMLGCGHSTWKVYAPQGKIYQAPDLCQALQQCLDAGEKSCSYETYAGEYSILCKQVTGSQNGRIH